MPEPTERSTSQAATRTARFAFHVGFLAFILSITVGVLALASSQSKYFEYNSARALSGTQMLAAELDDLSAVGIDQSALDHLASNFEQFKRFRSSQLAIFDASDRILLHSGDTTRVGASADTLFERSGETRPSLAHLAIEEKPWSGIVEADGVRKFAIIVASKENSVALVVLTPMSDLEAAVHDAVLPWALALGLIVLVFIPVPLFLLHRASWQTLAAEAKARERAETSEAALAATIESLPYEVWVHDLEGTIRLQNANGIRESGMMVGKSVSEVGLSTEVHEFWEASVARAIQGEVVEVEYSKEVDGERRYYLSKLAPIRTERGLAGATGIRLDMTRQRRVESELALALQRIQAHVDNSPLGPIEWDGEFNVVRWSGGAERMLGWKSEEMLGRPIAGPDSLLAPSASATAALSRMRDQGVDRLVFEGSTRTREGRALVCTWHNSLLRDEQGNIVSTLSLLQDITSQAHASNLRFIQDRLLQRIASGATMTEALEDLLLAIAAVLPEARSSILLTDHDGQRLRSGISHGLAQSLVDAVDGMPIGPNSGACGAAAWKKHTIIVHDVSNDVRMSEFQELLREHEVLAVWSQPILSIGGDVLGTFALYFRTPRVPTRAELEYLETAASVALLALLRRNARWIEDTQREILREILDEKPLGNILHNLVVGIERQVPGMLGGVLLRDPDGQRLRPAAGPSFHPEVLAALDGLLIAPDSGTCGTACYRRELYASNDFEHDPSMKSLWPLLSKHGLRSGWSKPVLSGDGEVLGTFAMYWRHRREPEDRANELLETATSLAALAIERHQARAVVATQEEIMRLVLEGAPLERTLTTLLSGIERQMLGMRGAVLLSSSDEKTLSVVAAPSLSQDFVRRLARAPIGHDTNPCGRSCVTKERVVVEDTELDPLTASAREMFAMESIRAAWSSPVLSAHGEVLGTTSSYWREPRVPTKREAALLDLTANMAGIAIERAQHEEQRQRLTSRLETLNEIGRAILESGTIEGIAGAAVERVRMQLRCSRVSVALLESSMEREKLIAVSRDPASSVRSGTRTSMDSLALRRIEALQAGRMLTFEDLSSLEGTSGLATQFEGDGIRAAVLCPIVRQDTLLGTLGVGLDRAGGLNAEDVQFLTEVASMLAVAMEQFRLHESERDLTTRLKTLHVVGRNILEEPSESAIALSSVEHIIGVLGCQRASVITCDSASKAFTVLAQVSRSQSQIAVGSKSAIEWHDFGDLERLRSGHQYSLDNVSDRRPRLQIHELLLAESVLSYTVTPLIFAGQFIGVLTAGRSKIGAFAEVELEFLREIAALLAVGLRQARLSAQLRANADEQRRLSERLATLNHVGRAILHSRTTNELMSAALSATRTAIGCTRASVSLIDEVRKTVTLASVDSSVPTSIPPGQVKQLGAFPYEDYERLRKGDAIWIEDMAALQQKSSSFEVLIKEGAHSLVQVPLIARDQLLGTLNLCFSLSLPATASEVELGRKIAGLLAVGLLQLQLHERVRTNAEELEQRVIERTLELTEVNEELESYVRTVSHDLRAPLRTIQGLGTAVLEDYGARLDVQGLDYLARVTSAAERMDRMLLDLLAYSRVGKTEILLKHVSVADAVREARLLVHSVLESSGAVIEVAPNLHSALGHGPTLVQAISNLLSNAAKFTRQDVVPIIRIWTEQGDRSVRIWIEDHGIGVAHEHHERIFRAFERLHAHDEYPGTGIGLAIVRRSAERMGGRAGVESTLGEGSRFWIELPADTNGS